MSLEIYNPRQTGNKAKRIQGKWVRGKAPRHRNCQAAKGPFEIWDLSFRFSEDVYNEIRNSRFGLLVPVAETFHDIYVKKGPQAAPKRDRKPKKTRAAVNNRKRAKGSPSIPLPISLPASPATLRSLLAWKSVRMDACGFSHFLAAISHCVDLANDKEYKKKRSKQNPSLRDSPKSFEMTTKESRKFLNRITFEKGQAKKTTTLMAFLEDTKIITKIKVGRKTHPSRGTTYAFTCKRFKTYEVQINPHFIPNAKERVSDLIEERSNHPLVEIYKANVALYSLSDEDIERLPYYIGFDAAGEPKFYESQYLELKNWDGAVNAKPGCYHSVYSRIPDVFRVRRRDENGVYLALADISSAHAVFLHKLFADEIERGQKAGKNVTQDKYELGQFGKDIEQGRLYDKFAKKPFLSLLNAFEGIELVEEIVEDLRREYPALALRLSNAKRRNKNKLYHLLHPMVNALMEEAVLVCKEWGFDPMILGDELDVPEHEALRVKDLLLDLIFEHTGLETWVKVTTREGDQRFRYQTKTPCPEDLCPHCWNENKAIRIASPFPCKHIKEKTDCQIQPKERLGSLGSKVFLHK
jgi:hypothetical protein